MRTPNPQGSICPVLAFLPRDLPRRARVETFRTTGLRALGRAARAASAPALAFARDEEGAPRDEGSWRWSLSNAEGLVAAVVAETPVGIDVEPRDRPRRESLLSYLRERDPEGLASAGSDGAGALLLWTAFEAALKLLGRGVSGLPETSLEAKHAPLPRAWRIVRVGARRVPVWSQVEGDHVVSLALDCSLADLPRIEPLVLDLDSASVDAEQDANRERAPA